MENEEKKITWDLLHIIWADPPQASHPSHVDVMTEPKCTHTYSIDQSCSEVACTKLPSIDRSVQQPVKAGEMALDLPLLSTWTNMFSPRGSKRGHISEASPPALKWPPAIPGLWLRMPALYGVTQREGRWQQGSFQLDSWVSKEAPLSGSIKHFVLIRHSQTKAEVCF